MPPGDPPFDQGEGTEQDQRKRREHGNGGEQGRPKEPANGAMNACRDEGHAVLYGPPPWEVHRIGIRDSEISD